MSPEGPARAQASCRVALSVNSEDGQRVFYRHCLGAAVDESSSGREGGSGGHVTSPADAMVTMEGLPVLDGRLLRAGDPIFASCLTLDGAIVLARRMRGQFAVVVRHGSHVIAITDLVGSRPIFYTEPRPGEAVRITTRLHDLRPYVSGDIAARALFFYAIRGGVGLDPFYAGVRALPGASVMHCDGSSAASATYVDWRGYLDERSMTLDTACDRFLEIAEGYLRPLVAGHSRVACLLSSGTDSALVASLLKRLGVDVLCLTADYRMARYSECAAAGVHARQIDVAHERVLVTRGSYRQSFGELNGCSVDLPASHGQLFSLHSLIGHAQRRGISLIVHGDHADALFMGFRESFAPFAKTADYIEHTDRLTEDQRLDRLALWRPLAAEDEALLDALGGSAEACRDWIGERRAADRAVFARWVESASFPRLQQLGGQIWAGIPFQAGWLPAQRAVGGEVELVSPFFDRELIRFGISLPMSLKFLDGVTKPLLREVLARLTGVRVEKVASPSPIRWWTLVPDVEQITNVDRRLQPLLARLVARNLMTAGRSYQRLLGVAALGRWLREHELSGSVIQPRA